MKITKALIVREPWISKILNHEKTWEMRRSGCNFHGFAGLIKSGTKTVVGIARFEGSLKPVKTLEEMAKTEEFHAIPQLEQEDAIQRKRCTPWPISEAIRLPEPVPYIHNNQHIWVRLHSDTSDAIEAQLKRHNLPSVTTQTSAPALQLLS